MLARRMTNRLKRVFNATFHPRRTTSQVAPWGKKQATFHPRRTTSHVAPWGTKQATFHPRRTTSQAAHRRKKKATFHPRRTTSQVAPWGKKQTAWRRVLAGLVALLVVVGVIIASVLLTPKSKAEDESKYTATCSHEDYTMWNPMKTCCNVTVPAGDDAGIDVRRTSFFLNSKELPVNCSPRATDGTITCTGPAVTCQFRGILTIEFFDRAGNVVLDKMLKLSSPLHPMVTSVVQVFETVDKDLMSYFNFTCAMTSSCDTVTMALFVAGNRYLTEENASLCINTLMTDRGYNKSCVFEIDEDVIRKQHSIDISCALLQDGGIAMHEKFRLPACSDVSSDCNCSAQQSSCGEICSKVGTCLKHDAASRYQNITTPRDPSLVTVCPVLCTPKWCRDTLNGDKTVTVAYEVLQAMCPNS